MAAAVKRKKHLNLCNKKRKSMKKLKHADESIELSKSNMSKVNIDLLNEDESNVIANSHSAPSTESLEHFDQVSVSLSPLLDQAQIKPADYSLSPILGNLPHCAINETNQVIVCDTNDRMMTDKSPEKLSSKSAIHRRTSLSFNTDLSGTLKYTNNQEVVGLSPVLDSSLLKIVCTPVNKKINCARNRAENINNGLVKSPILDSIHCRQSNQVHSTKKLNETVSKSNTEVGNVPHNYFRCSWLESYAPSEAIITNASLKNCNTNNNIARNLSHNVCNSPESSKITFIQSHLEENKPTSPILDSVCRRKISSPQFFSPSIRSKKFINCSKDMMDDRSSIDSYLSPKEIKTILNSCGELHSTSSKYSSENDKSCEKVTDSARDNGTTSPVLGNEKYHQHIVEGSSSSWSEQESSSLSEKQNLQASFSSLKMQNSDNCMVKSSNILHTCSTASIANTMHKTDMTFGPSLNDAGGDLTFKRLMPDSSSKIISSNYGIAQKPSNDELNLHLAMADKSKNFFNASKTKADDELQGFNLMDNGYIIDSSTNKSINEWCLSNSANNVQRAKRKLDFNCAQNNLNLAIHSTENGSSLKTENNEVKRKCKIRPQRGGRLARSGKLKLNIDEISYSENPPEVLVNKHDIIIEEFDEDSPDKNNKDLFFREYQSTNLNDVVDSCLDPAKWAFSSQSGGKHLENGRAKQDLKESDLDCLRSLDILESRANIEDDDLLQESVGSDGYKIECSTSPLTKSFEETQSEKNMEILSFPPALDVVSSNNIAKSVDILDSASKTRKSKSKRGSFSERLQRLIRSEKAEVNMFHHETQSSQHCGACLLRVNETTHVASRLILTCQYVSSQGSNCMDPQVQIFINPDFSKKITLGSNILIYPPWQTIWLEHHRVLLVFGVSKLRLSTEVSIVSRPTLSNAEFFFAQSFSCSPQTNEGCGCQREFMKQLFQASQEPQMFAPAKFSVTAALSTLGSTDQVALKFKVLRSFSKRYEQEVLQCLICVDQDNCIFQLNLPTSVQGIIW